MQKTTDLKGATGVYTVNLDTLSMCPGGHPILYRGLKLSSKISAGNIKKTKFTGVSWFSTGDLSKKYV